MGSFLAALRRSLRQVAAIGGSSRTDSDEQGPARTASSSVRARPWKVRALPCPIPDKLPLHAARLLPSARRAHHRASVAGARRGEPAAVAAVARGLCGIAGGAGGGAGAVEPATLAARPARFDPPGA